MPTLPASCARAVLLGDAVAHEREEAFFRRLALPNGTFKTTRRGRLRDVDVWLLEQLSPLPASLEVLDVAVSSGVTTAELLEALRERGVVVQAVATDLTLLGELLCFGSHFDLLRDSRGTLLELRAGRFVKGRPHDLQSPRRFVGWFALAAIAGVLRMLRVAGFGVSHKVPLLSLALRREAGVTLEEADLFHAEGRWRRAFDLVRAANILNPAYFGHEQLRAAAMILAGYLRPGGHLLVAQSDDDGPHGNRASLLRLEGDALVAVARFNGGSEIDALVSGSPPPATSSSRGTA
jgi:SAM-dependent methyltransferase